MARLPRLQYEDAIYHVVTRGDGRRALFPNQEAYAKFTEGLVEQVDRCGWQVIAYCWMPHDIQLLLRTPKPNLARGMQHWLSGYANWYTRQTRRSGNLYQGRYKAYPVEDEEHYWGLSRSIHLAPCLGPKPLATSPEGYPESSYAGYAKRSKRVEWIDYEQHHRHWVACNDGDPDGAYRHFVKSGLHKGADPTVDRLKGWVYGSEKFLRKMVAMASRGGESPQLRRELKKSTQTVDAVIAATAKEYKVKPQEYVGFRSHAAGRDIAAFLCRRYTTATLAELSERFGLTHQDSASGLVKRGREAIEQDREVAKRVAAIERRLSVRPD
jgi:REP element-mobilizing transposase RayT